MPGTTKKKFVVTVERDEAGWFVVECPALPGCLSQGRNLDEALGNIREAITASLETRRARGLTESIDTVEVEVEAPVS